MRRIPAAAAFAGLAAGACVYFNAVYNAEQAWETGLREQRRENRSGARAAFDSVIAKTGRVLTDHRDSKYADDAARLKARAELETGRWESAEASAALALELADDGRGRAQALGLSGRAAVELGNPVRADSLLTAALAMDLPAADRTAFLFARGRARLALERPEEAAADLQAAAGQLDLSPEARLDLADALIRIGRFDQASVLVARLLDESSAGAPPTELRRQVDTLTALAPTAMERELAGLTEVRRASDVERSLLHLLHGRALEAADRPQEALRAYDAALEAARFSFPGAEAAYWSSRLRIDRAREADSLRAVAPALQEAAVRAPFGLKARADSLYRRVERFDELVGAVEGRGASAAEALLRAAEIAGSLGAEPVARRLYLRYLELQPRSRWAAKAVAGALAFAPPDADPGTERLQALLAELPAEDPYRQALAGGGGDAVTDSAYMRAEAALRDRLDEIQRLFAPAASDTARAPADADEEDGGEPPVNE